MLIAALLACLSQVPQPAAPPLPEGITRHPAPAALAAKAPGQPSYGLRLATPLGQFLLTNLYFHNEHGWVQIYRMNGPAGLGPYRPGVFLWSNPRDATPEFLTREITPGGPADAAGLDSNWHVLKVDGKTFEWNTQTVNAYLSNRPEADLLARKVKGWGSGKEKVFHLVLRRQDPPADPTDCTLVQDFPAWMKPLFNDQGLWLELAKLRSTLPRFTPLAVDLGGAHYWVVRSVPNPHPVQGTDGSRIFLEFWASDPASGSGYARPAFLVPEPSDGRLQGRILKIQGRWFKVAEAALDAGNGRLAKLKVEPWKADALALLGGELPARDLGPSAPTADMGALEQLGNEALIEWKTRALPGLLPSLSVNPAEDLVIRIEKGILALDLTVKRLRTRLDADARAEAERKAQAELAARSGQAAPKGPAVSTEDTERLADLLEQRKAILMAVLGNVKQALANLRR